MDASITVITCPICQEPYKTPKYLPCLHSFCEACLERYIVNIATICQKLEKLPASIFDAKPYVWTGDGFPCPVCRSHVTVPQAKSMKPSEWSSKFPVNQLIRSIMGKNSILSEAQVCGPCDKSDDPKEALHWCMECSEALCIGCAKHHQYLKVTSSHTVAKISDLKNNQTTLGMFSHEEVNKCLEHGEKVINMYCVDHNKVACSECVANEHRSCENVVGIDTVAGEIRNSTESLKLLGKLKECTEETDCVVMDRKRNIDNLNVRKDKMLNKMHKVREEINKVLDNLENLFVEEMDGLHAKVLGELQDQIGRCALLQKAIHSSRGVLQAAITEGTDNELFVVAHRMEKELHKYENVLENETVGLCEIDYEFAINYEIEHVMKALDEIGTLNLIKTPTTVSPFVKKHARPISYFDATSAMDERCAELTGGTFLPDDRLLLVDNGNEKLKLFTPDGESLCELELSSAPWDIACIPGGMAAVTLPVEKKVLLVSGMNDCITPVEEFSTSGKCYGIAYSYHDKDLVVACDTPSDGKATVKVMTVAGEELRDIAVGQDGETMITRPSYVATNPFNSDVYVSDECNNTVIGMTMTGDFRFRVKEPYLQLPVGIASDNHGCVYVCGNGSCDIHQISRDGERHRLLTDGLTHPRAVAFDPYGERFLVTSDGSYKSTVQIYALE